ncbi:DUF4231 domain-containing protein [Algoriphagus sp. A40]|uniref:DUF4231 domain-containing protein n=1 Tax=Algoriphagus sp. A40 TaxID=1945863 RepID=UPI0009878D15|nr:DUF4231 domain-containing protein [Algoriphagus sp. A40]OOG77103.1 hypothetical protein B0E43_05755 [Algoriphagus sp. A40]
MKQNNQFLNPYLLNPQLSAEEKIMLVNNELQRLLTHFDTKSDKAKTNFHFYKYTSIVLAAFTTIVSSLQVIYPESFPLWILPVVSAGATVAVAFLGASSAQRIWINSRTTGQQLQAEQFLFNQQAGSYYNISKEESLRLFSERMIQLWNEGHGKWEQTVNEG